MSKSTSLRLFGLFLIFAAGVAWAVMLGYVAVLIPLDSAAWFTGRTAAWLTPGVLAFPASLSVLAALAGTLFMWGAAPLEESFGTRSIANK
jgi:hypothetical protein